MTLESPADMVIYRSRLNAKINRNFEVLTPTEICHLRFAICYLLFRLLALGYPTAPNIIRSSPTNRHAKGFICHRPFGPSVPSVLPPFFKSEISNLKSPWPFAIRHLPSLLPRRRSFAFTNFSFQLSIFSFPHDPPATLSPPGAPGPYTYEPCDDVDPMP
jgi:hypothetical protein